MKRTLIALRAPTPQLPRWLSASAGLIQEKRSVSKEATPQPVTLNVSGKDLSDKNPETDLIKKERRPICLANRGTAPLDVPARNVHAWALRPHNRTQPKQPESIPAFVHRKSISSVAISPPCRQRQNRAYSEQEKAPRKISRPTEFDEAKWHISTQNGEALVRHWKAFSKAQGPALHLVEPAFHQTDLPPFDGLKAAKSLDLGPQGDCEEEKRPKPTRRALFDMEGDIRLELQR